LIGTTASPTPAALAGDHARPRLLVSVRDAAEAAEALAGGAEVIDVKEPSRGALGAASAESARAVIAAVGSRAPVTVAWGEWADGFPNEAPAAAAVKVGLAGGVGRGWRETFAAVRKRLPATTRLVPVAYADEDAADAPPWAEALSFAVERGDGWLVLDTWSKRGLSSLDLLGADEIARRLDEARRHAVRMVVAGGLSLDDVSAVANLGPAVVGVRGAACVASRVGRVSRARVRRLAHQIATAGSRAGIERP